jgi:putative tryptophan/tyrosine transport system substrate-binding protein
MKRREFITLVSGAAVLLPLAAGAQQQGMPVIGFLSSRKPGEAASDLAAFRRGLGQTGYFEGKVQQLCSCRNTLTISKGSPTAERIA